MLQQCSELNQIYVLEWIFVVKKYIIFMNIIQIDFLFKNLKFVRKYFTELIEKKCKKKHWMFQTNKIK